MVAGIRTVATSLVRTAQLPCTINPQTDTIIAQNGSAAYVPPITSLSLHYCDWAGSSRGMNAFLRSPLLSHLTSTHPHVEFAISPRPGQHPVIKASYVNGREKAICVKNMRVEEIKAKCKLLLGNDGAKNRLVKGRKVVSRNESVRGVWSALHGGIKDI
jgi:large subunit ribosomal protein L43